MNASTTEIAGQVRQYIRENLLYMRPEYLLNDDSRLLEERVIDSMGVMELIGFLEQRFGIGVRDEEVTEANLGTIAAIAHYVGGKLDDERAP